MASTHLHVLGLVLLAGRFRDTISVYPSIGRAGVTAVAGTS